MIVVEKYRNQYTIASN